jgi:flavorubredoxin
MASVLIAYFSRTGNTEQMASYIAEGIRMSGHDVEQKRISEIKTEKDISGYDGYVFGCPTYHRDMTEGMKRFLFVAHSAGLEGKAGGAFGSYTHSGDAPKLIYDTMENVFKMKMTDLGSFNLKEDVVPTTEGLRACQAYGRAIGDALSG